jgi:predicted nucleotidyltransferase
MVQTIATSRALQDEALQEIVRRIVQFAQPEKIILFGSGARGTLSPNSDLDLLVIKSGAHRRKLAQAIYRQLYGVGYPVDVIVVTPEDIRRYGNNPDLIIEPALREGKVLYAA